MIDSPCLSAETLQQLLTATAEGPATDTARAHLEGCERCLMLLDELSEDPEMHRWAAEGPALRRSRPEEPGLQRLVQDLCAASAGGTLPGAAPVPLTFLGPPRQAGDLGTLGPYRVLAELGRGGRGVVLRGYDEELDREVALKVLRPDLEAGTHARLLAEARAAARFQHGNVIAVHAVADTPEGLPYLVMEYLRGPTLAERLRERPPPAVDEVVTAVAQVADALAAAHAAGLVHRDVKPGNILLDSATGRAKLLDFGLARTAAQPGARTLEGFLAGTPAYMSPEQARGQALLDGRSDVYGLGATLYEILTGEPPFRGKPHLVLQQVLLEEPRPPRRLNDAVPRDLETVCLKAMAKEPSGRYQTARAFADDLRCYQRGEPIHARPVSRPERLWRWGRRNPWLAILTTALVLAVAGGFAAVFWQWRRAEFNAAHARLQAEEARHQKDEALANLGQACQAVDRFLTEVSESDLAKNPGTQTLRKRLLQEALTCYQALLRRHGSDPQLLDAVAKAWFRVGTTTYLEIGKVEEAQAAFVTAVEKYEELRRREPANPAYPSALAGCLGSLGLVHQRAGRLEEAAQALRRAADLLEPLIAAQPGDRGVQNNLVAAHGNLANISGQLRRTGKAIHSYERVRDLLGALLRVHPTDDNLPRKLATTENNLALVQTRPEDSLASLQRARVVRERLALLAPQDDWGVRDLAQTDMNRGIFLVKLNRLGEARQAYRQSIERLQGLVQDNPRVGDYRLSLAMAYVNAAKLRYKLKQVPEEVELLVQSRDLAEQLLREDPSGAYVRSLLGGCCTALSVRCRELGRLDEAAAASRRLKELRSSSRGKPSAKP